MPVLVEGGGILTAPLNGVPIAAVGGLATIRQPEGDRVDTTRMARYRHLARGITRAVLTGARMRAHNLDALSATDALQGEHGIADGNRQRQRVVLTHRERRVLLHMEGWHATRDRARVPVVRLDDAERVFRVRHVCLDGTVKRVL